ncbi:MAG: signal peptidase I [Terrimesophilobacter sp.]
MSRSRNSETTEHGIWHYIGVGLSAGLLALVAGLAALVIVIPALIGGVPLTVLTSSMEPALPPGTLVVVKPTPLNEIGLGAVLTYQIHSGDPAVVSHRVIARSVSTNGSTAFVTKGDNNDLADVDPVTAAQVRGTVWYSVPLLGYVNNVVNGPDRGWVVPSVAIGLFLYAGYMILGAVLPIWRRRRSESASTRGRRKAARHCSARHGSVPAS